MEDTIIVKNVTKTFHLSKKQQLLNHTKNSLKIAVNDLSFVAHPHEIFGLLGPNGAGKTTTLRLIATLLKPDKGEILVDGIGSNNAIELKRHLGFLTNELKLEEQMTPNYAFGYYARFFDIDVNTMESRRKELFDYFGINEFSECKIGELSTGMKQKVSIVVSLVNDPAVIVFDEPTNGLDIITARLVTDYLKQLREKGKTIVISTHITSLVEKLCDRVGIIINGKMALCDSLKNVMALKPDSDLEDIFFDIYNKEVGDDNEAHA